MKPLLRNGVKASEVFLPEGDWPTLHSFFIQKFPHISAQEWQQRFAAGDVLNKLQQAVAAETRYEPLQHLYYFRDVQNETRIPFEETILFEDDLLLVADKPHFLPVIPAGKFVQECLLVRLRNRTGHEALTPIHRIDRETAGLVVFCKQDRWRGAYQTLFARHAVEKTYQAIAAYKEDLTEKIYRSRLRESDKFMQMQECEGEPNSETRIRILEHIQTIARYELTPVTGKKHQLRIHLNALGAPILYDQIYPQLRINESINDYTQPLQLLAEKIAFLDPLNKQERQFITRRQLLPLRELADNA